MRKDDEREERKDVEKEVPKSALSQPKIPTHVTAFRTRFRIADVERLPRTLYRLLVLPSTTFSFPVVISGIQQCRSKAKGAHRQDGRHVTD